MQQPSNENQEQRQRPQNVSWRSPEILGEIILLAFVMGLVILYLIELPGLRTAARWLPAIAIGFTLPFWFIRVYNLFQRKKSMEQGMIMDLGFRFGSDPQAERRRAVLYMGSIAALFVGIWLFGFHIWLTGWVLVYLALFAKVHPVIMIGLPLAFLGLILVVLDGILDIEWFEPLFFRMINVEYPFNEWPISEPF